MTGSEAASTAAVAKGFPGSRTSILVRLSVMMFLQYAIWGAWSTGLAQYLMKPTFAGGAPFSGQQVGWIFSCLWLGCMVAPFLGGQIADRWMPTQVFLGIAHLVGAAFLYLSAVQTRFPPMFLWMLIYSLCYAPTLALTNSICMRNLVDTERDFGKIRLWGTIGWIVAGLLVAGIRYVWHTGDWNDRSDLFLIAALLSAIMGLYCFALPHTPPTRSATNPLAFLEALSLLRDRNFLVFMLISFVVTTELQFYYIPTSAFLVDRGVSDVWVTAVMTIAQVAEIAVLAWLLHRSLRHFGVRRTMVIGVLAWPLRYLLFAIPSLPIIIGALTLHGFGYAFFFVASQIYVNCKARDDMRASAQALLTFFTLGVGMFVGTYVTGWFMDFFKTAAGVSWSAFFLVPTGICVACAVAFMLLFREDVRTPQPQQP